MDIYKADIDLGTTANRDPGSPNPFEIDVAVDQNMEMRVAVLLEFEDSDILRSNSTLPLEINPQFGEGGIQIANRVSLNFLGIKG